MLTVNGKNHENASDRKSHTWSPSTHTNGLGICLKVLKYEIFDGSDLHDFYTIKAL
jgi:hypothetical protein